VLALGSFEPAKFDVLLRGHLGELAKASTAYPFHTDATVFTMTSKPALLTHLLARQESLNHGSRAQGLFTPSWSEAANPGAARASIESFADADLAPADLCSYIYLTEYHRRVTIPSLDIFRNVGEVRLPLADEAFVTAVLRGDSKWRDGLEIHQTIVRRLNPKFLKVRNPNTGAPAGAGPLQEFVLDKLNSVLRRLNVYGYRHYHAFDGWMRKALLDLADEVLFSPETLDRGVLQQAPLRRLMDLARQGDSSPDHVLQVLVLVELWQRDVA
jgi:asparagine synthase (glutamine-hydrolysing)